MSSPALTRWREIGLRRLDELEAVHVQLTGRGPGRRWGTDQLNRSLFLALVAQFQAFCRDLHDEAAKAFLAEATPAQRSPIEVLLTQGRRLDRGNPTRGALGADFARVGIGLVSDLKSRGVRTRDRLDALDRVIEFRNAVAHGNEPAIEQLSADGAIRATRPSYERHRGFLDNLAVTMDDVVAEQLARLLQTERPW